MTKLSRAVLPVALLLSLSLTACTSSGEAAKPPQTESPATSQAATSSQTETPAPAVGTRSNPVPADTLTEYSPESQWQFSIGVTDADATPEIMSQSGGITPPQEGYVFVSAPIRVLVKDTGSPDGSSPGASLMIDYVSAAGNSYVTGGVYCYGIGHLYGVGDMYPGAETTATICASVPAEDVAGGTWKVASAAVPGDSIFIAGAS